MTATDARTGAGAASDPPVPLDAGDEGYDKGLKPRQVQMIAIGTGLFLGAGARLQIAGPALAAVDLVCRIFSFLIPRALVMYRPTSGSFVS